MNLLIDSLDKIAEKYIPEGRSNLFHVHCRTAWVETVYELIENGHIQPTNSNIEFLAKFWEHVLAKKFSTLN